MNMFKELDAFLFVLTLCFQCLFISFYFVLQRRSDVIASQKFLCAGCGTEIEPRKSFWYYHKLLCYVNDEDKITLHFISIHNCKNSPFINQLADDNFSVLKLMYGQKSICHSKHSDKIMIIKECWRKGFNLVYQLAYCLKWLMLSLEHYTYMH